MAVPAPWSSLTSVINAVWEEIIIYLVREQLLPQPLVLFDNIFIEYR